MSKSKDFIEAIKENPISGCWKDHPDVQDRERLVVGPYTIVRFGEHYWIEHESGEGMQVFRVNFEQMIDEYYKKEF